MIALKVATLVMVAGVLLTPLAAGAQSAASGGIAGVVKDTSGAVLPGVTVEAASPSLIEKIRTVVTDNQGNYKIVELRPGIYSVTFRLPGFTTMNREGVELTTGFTATVNAELSVATLEETVTVSGASPTVDVQNVRQQQVFTRDVLDALPISRGSDAALAGIVVGARLNRATIQDVGGSGSINPSALSIHGGPVVTTFQDGMEYSATAYSPNYSSSQEVTVQTVSSAETESGGLVLNFVPKEGGNTVTGYFAATYGDKNLQNTNLTDTLRARGTTEVGSIKQLYSVSGALGGPIKKERLLFYAATQDWGTEAFAPGNYYNKTQESWLYTPDLSRPAYLDSHYWDGNIRLTWLAAQKHKVNFYYSRQRNCYCFFGLAGGFPGAPSADFAPEATGRNDYTFQYPQVTWSYVATNRLLFEAGIGALLYRLNLLRQAGVTADAISVLELARNYRYRARGGPISTTGAYGDTHRDRASQRFSVSYVTGSHAFKTGVSVQEGWSDLPFEINGSASYTFLNGVPQSVTYWATPFSEHERLMPNLGIYVQDQWTKRKLTLNLGLRFDYLREYVPAQHLPAGPFVPARDFPRVDNVPNWKDLSPRLGAVYDVFGNGKTAVKVAVGRAVTFEWYNVSTANNPVNTSVNSATRTWNDANRDYIPQPNELGPLSPATFGQPRITTRWADDVLRGFGIRPSNWQGSASLQHELRPGIALNLGYFRTWYGNFTVTDNLAVTPADYDPFCIMAPVDARLPGGGGNQVCGLYDIKPAKFGQQNNLLTQASHYGKVSQVHNGVDVAINARFGEGGLLSGGLSTGRTVTDNCAAAVDSPQKRFCRVTLPFEGHTQVKFSGVFPLPWDLQASATYQNLPGIPITASYVASNAEIAPSLGRNLAAGARGVVLVDLIEPNTQFEDRISQLDVRLARILRVGRARMQGSINVYNVLNAAPILSANTRYGNAWLVPISALSARTFKLGVELNF